MNIIYSRIHTVLYTTIYFIDTLIHMKFKFQEEAKTSNLLSHTNDTTRIEVKKVSKYCTVVADNAATDDIGCNARD